MKKTLLFFLLMSIAFGAAAQDTFKKYDMKSCIAKKITTTSGHETEGTVYVDNYGAFECDIQTIDVPGFITYDMGVVTRKDRIWTFNVNEGKVQSKESPNPLGDFNLLEVTDEMAKKYEMKDLGEEEYLGKKCRKISYVVIQNRKRVDWTAWVYKGFPLKCVIKQGRRESVVEVVDFQENVPIPDNILNLIPE